MKFDHAIIIGQVGFGISLKFKPKIELIVIVWDHYFEVGFGAE